MFSFVFFFIYLNYACSAIGYTYKVAFNTSFNPVSRQDSERQSCSSAGQTSDSEVNSK